MKHLLLELVLHLLRIRVTPGALLIEIMSKSRCFIYWDSEWDQVLYWLRLWVRAGASFIETMSETRCFIDWDYEEDQVLHLLRLPRSWSQSSVTSSLTHIFWSIFFVYIYIIFYWCCLFCLDSRVCYTNGRSSVILLLPLFTITMPNVTAGGIFFPEVIATW
jgi:hypothetical protein